MSATAAARKVRYREYETIYLMKPDVSKEAAAKIAQRVEDVMKREGARLVVVEMWGRRQLSFAVGRYRRAVYVFLKYIGGPTVVAELERTFRMMDDIVKYQTIVTDPNVNIEQVAVDPDAVKFEELNLPDEIEDEKALERALGFIEPEPGQRRGRDAYDDEQSELEALREMGVVAEDLTKEPPAREEAP